MGRTPKNIELAEGKRLKEEAVQRGWVEDLFGADLSKGLKPSNRLNANQKKIFKFILDNYTKNVNVLCDIDAVLLENTAIAIDRLHSIEKLINSDFENIRDRNYFQPKGFIKLISSRVWTISVCHRQAAPNLVYLERKPKQKKATRY